MLDQKVCNMVFREEAEKFMIDKKDIYWRFGYYNEIFRVAYLSKDRTGKYRITICEVGGYNDLRRLMRHELWHYKYLNNWLSNEFIATLAEFFPIEKFLLYRDI